MSTSTLTDRKATPEEMDQAVGLFKVLSHPERLRLVCALGDGRVTTQKELVEEFGWPQSTAARHVAALRNSGLIVAERDGTEIHLRLGNPVALHLLETVCDWVHAGPEVTRTFFPVPSLSAPAMTPVGTSRKDHGPNRASF